MMEGGGEDDGGVAVVGSQEDGSSCSTSTKDLRLDDWIIYQHDQIQRNADILKDDLETVRKRCMVPDLPKLVKENKRSVKLSKSIVNQFQGVIQKHIDVMGKLSLDMSLELHERFLSESQEMSLLAVLPAVSPPSSTTADPEGQPTMSEAKPDFSGSEIETERNEHQNPSPVLGRKNSMRAESTSPVEHVAALSSFEVMDHTGTEAGPGNESDCSNCSTTSGKTVLMPRTYAQKLAKKTFSPVKVEKEETTKIKEKKKKKRVPTIDEVLAMPIPDFLPTPTTALPAEGNGEHSNDATEPNTDGGTQLPAETDDNLSYTQCPKLTQITKVVLNRLPKNALEKLRKKNGRIASTELDELDKSMASLLKYNPFLKPVAKEGKKKSMGRTANSKENSEDTNEQGELSDGNVSLDSDSCESSLMSIPSVVAKNNQAKETYDSENYSDMEDLSAESDAAEEGDGDAKKKENASSNQTKKTQTKYVTPIPFFSSDEEELLGIAASKKKVGKGKTDVDEEKRPCKTEKNPMPDTNDDDKESGNETDKDNAEQAAKENKTKEATPTDSDSDSDFSHFTNRQNQKLLERKKLAKNLIRSDDSDDSDFVPSPMKRVAPSKGSDTEETGSDSDVKSLPMKRSKKRALASGSDSDSSTKITKKRRRIKKEQTSGSDGNDSDVMVVEPDKEPEKGSSPKKGIRKMMSKKELQKSTRQAGKEEEDRKKRVSENQKLYNQLFSSQLEKGERLTELVLDFDKTTKQPLLSVDPTIVKQLKPHQVEGIKFMWETCYESVKTVQSKDGGGGGGCILAHCMGLGKTLQTIGFLHTVLNSAACKTKLALVICPLNTVGNWYNEFQQWCADCDIRPRIHKLWDAKGKGRFEALSDWQRLGGVGIIHYESFRILASINEKKKGRPTQKELKIVETSLLNPGPDIVVCDEGHLLKNATTQQAKAVMKIRTPRRVVLTGTPLQNNLIEYHTMMSFVKPNLLGTKKEFRNRFVNPIEKGQSKSSDANAVSLMKRRAHVLHKLLDGCVQRLDYSVLTPYLPPKFEYAIAVNLSQLQKDLYQHYLENYSGKSASSNLSLLPDYQALAKVWTHPVVLTYKRRNQASSDSETGSLKDFIDDDATTTDDSEMEAPDSDVEIIEKPKSSKEGEISVPPSPLGDWFSGILKSRDDLENNIELSGKILVLFEILKTCSLIEDKVLVFSQFLTSLDVIEEFLAQMDNEAKLKAKDEPMTFPPSAAINQGRWRPNIEYYRIDGSTKTEDRQKSCKIFNQEKATRAKLFLISTKAGSLGINLTGANRVVVFDASWNPSQDIQSIFRVYRFGQSKPCYIYRLLARGTMEEKIYNRQVVKLSLSCRVVDEQQIERHFQYDEVQEMYDFNPNDKTERPIPAVPKDRLLADLLISHKDWIFSYLEHDSLLENKAEEKLTEEERKAAWEEYNNEERPKLSYAQDAWTIAIVQSLKLRYPTKTDLEIYQITQKARQDFDYMERLVALIQTCHDPVVENQYSNLLSTKAAELKTIFGDDTDWTNMFQTRRAQLQPQPKPQQPKVVNNFQQATGSMGNSTYYINNQSQPSSSASFNSLFRDHLTGQNLAYEATRHARMNSSGAAEQRQTPIFQSLQVPGFSGSQNSRGAFPGPSSYQEQNRRTVFSNGDPLNNSQQRPTSSSSSRSQQQRPFPGLTSFGTTPQLTNATEGESILPDLVDLD